MKDLFIVNKKDNKEKTKIHIITAVGIPIFAVASLLFVYIAGSPLFCIFYKITGLYCSGCGTGRAIRDLLHLDIMSALSHNVLFTALIPFIGYYFFAWYINFITNKKIIKVPRITKKGSVILGIIVIMFFVLRNIPFESFIILAP